MSYRLVDHVMTSAGDLADAEFRLLLLLSRHADDDGSNAYPSVAALARASGKQPRAIKYILRRLRVAGWIDVQTRGGGRGRATRYRVNRSPIPMLPMLGAAAPRKAAKVRRQTVQAVAPFPGALAASETVQSVVETVQSDVILPRVAEPEVAQLRDVARMRRVPTRSVDSVRSTDHPPTPSRGGVSAHRPKRLRAREQRRVEEMQNVGRPRWTLVDDCPHRDELAGAMAGVCAGRVACELRQAREVTAGTRALGDVHPAIRSHVEAMAEPTRRRA